MDNSRTSVTWRRPGLFTIQRREIQIREKEGLGKSHKKKELTDKRKNIKEREKKLHVDVALCAGVFKIHRTFLKLQGQ